MKNLFSFLAVSLMSVAAFAWPTTGDAVTYDLTLNFGGQNVAGDMTMTVQAVNAASDSVSVQTSVNILGRTQVENSSQRLSEMNQFAAGIPQYLANCQGAGGQPEVVSTASGQFQTCKIPNNSSNSQGFIWVANVKFGFVKAVSVDPSSGSSTTIVFRNQN